MPLSVLLVACGGRGAPPPRATEPRVIRVEFAGAAAPQRLEPPVDPAERDCVDCHAERAAEHAASLHSQSFTNPIFAAAYAEEPLPSCRHCHAPRWVDAETRPLRALGVDCWTCHVRNGSVVGAHRRPGSPHRGPVDPRMQESVFCAGCHEFAFTDDVDHGLAPRSDLAQSTFSEWTRSAAAAEGLGCADCHMPAGDHGVSVRRRPELVRSAFALSVQTRCVDSQLHLLLRLEARDVGHAVPTGDLFRAIVVRASAVNGTWAEHAFERRLSGMARRGRAGAIGVRAMGSDRRVPEPGFDAVAEAELVLPSPTPTVNLTVSHRLLPRVVAARHGLADEAMTQLEAREISVDPNTDCGIGGAIAH